MRIVKGETSRWYPSSPIVPLRLGSMRSRIVPLRDTSPRSTRSFRPVPGAICSANSRAVESAASPASSTVSASSLNAPRPGTTDTGAGTRLKVDRVAMAIAESMAGVYHLGQHY